jgi:hypothetical protein
MSCLAELSLIIPMTPVIQIFGMPPVSHAFFLGTDRTRGWDDWNNLFHADQSSSWSAWLHRNWPNVPNIPLVWQFVEGQTRAWIGASGPGTAGWK